MQIRANKIVMLKPDEIIPNANQPRKHFDEYELQSLAESIRINGILQPLSVRKNENGNYELIAGERRLRAAVKVGLRRIPCVIYNADPKHSAYYALIENIQRQNLSFFEEIEGIARLINEFGMDRAQVAEHLGLAHSTLSNKLRLLRIPTELRARLEKAGLSERHARQIVRLPPELYEKLLDHIIAQGLTVKQTEDFINDLLSPKKEPEVVEETTAKPEPMRKMAIGDIRLFANSLNKLVNTMVDSGISASSRRKENETYIEYTIKISKASINDEGTGCQLRIC